MFNILKIKNYAYWKSQFEEAKQHLDEDFDWMACPHCNRKSYGCKQTLTQVGPDHNTGYDEMLCGHCNKTSKWQFHFGMICIDPVKKPETEDKLPIGYSYELANYITASGDYTNWKKHISFTKPNVPKESIRNILALYSGPDLCDDEGCPHFGSPHVCVNSEGNS